MSNEREIFLNEAKRIGHRLCRQAIWDGERCNWLGWSMEYLNGGWSPAYRSFGPDLYSGTAGIALFLAQLHALAPEPAVERTLIGAVNHLLSRVEKMAPAVRLGYYSGWSGVADVLLRIGRQLGHEKLEQRGRELMREAARLPADPRAVDVIGGSAGLIPALLDSALRYGDDELLAAAKRHGDHLLGLAQKGNEGWAWDTMSVPGQLPLTGHSHGTAGIVVALLELYRQSGDEKYLRGAQGGLRYERAHFRAEHGNWPDFRHSEPGNPPPEYACNMAWCHGAPGIGIARLRSEQLLEGDDRIRGEIEVAVNTTAHSLSYPPTPGQGNYSLCHGAAGNAELLLLAADPLQRPELHAQAEAVGRHGIEQFGNSGVPWPCGIHQAGESPNLMLGTAGIGYFYLRLYDSDAVPTMLCLTPGEPGAEQGLKRSA